MIKGYHNNMTEAEFRLLYRQEPDLTIKAWLASEYFETDDERYAFVESEFDHERNSSFST